MIEIALRFGWIAQSIVLLSAVILVMYIIISEDWDKESTLHSKVEPKGAIQQYISDFNSEKELERNFHLPFMLIRNGEKSIHKDLKKFINFKGLKKGGWKYTRINSLDIVSELKNTAIVRLNFSRLNKLDEKYLRANAYYTLTKLESKWGISSLIIDADVPLGT
tara:strand:- start:846 stop:1337 length:492 start_codon:yes stop_codon:yes gene_type:complete